jgi:hypothetical protein
MLRNAFRVALSVVVAVLAAGLVIASDADARSANVLASPPGLINDLVLEGAQPSWLQGLANTQGVSFPIFDATPAERQALDVMEQEAVQDVVTDHQLLPSDIAAVNTWARPEALAELWGLIFQALRAQHPNPDQQHVVTWLQHVLTAETFVEAYAAGAEFVKWAAFDPGPTGPALCGALTGVPCDLFLYDKAVTDSIAQNNWGVLRTFMAQEPQFHDPTGGGGPYGWCDYNAPDGTYAVPLDENLQLPGPCRNPPDYDCGFGATCTVGTSDNPPLTDLLRWGLQTSYLPLVSEKDLVALEAAVARQFAYGQAAGVGLPANTIVGPAYSGAFLFAIAAALHPLTAGVSEAGHLGAEFAVEGVDIAAQVTSGVLEGIAEQATEQVVADVVEGLTVADAVPIVDAVAIPIELGIEIAIGIADKVTSSEVPSTLAGMMENAQSSNALTNLSKPDVRTLAGTPNGQAALFTLFLASTMPTPKTACSGGITTTCSSSVRPPDANATPFSIAKSGSTAAPTANSFTYYDAATLSSHCVYLHNGWFVEHVTFSGVSNCSEIVCPTHQARCSVQAPQGGILRQTLHITYTDWNGVEQTVWVIPTDSGGYQFVRDDYKADVPSPLNPLNGCTRQSHCGVTDHIDYLSDAQSDRYTATLNRGNGVPTVERCTGVCGTPSNNTATTLAGSLNSNATSVALTAHVARGCAGTTGCTSPSGTVSFVLDLAGKDRTLCSYVPVTAGVATCTTKWSGLAAVAGTIYATFSPVSTTGTGGSQKAIAVSSLTR